MRRSAVTGCRSVLFTDSTFLLRFLPPLLALFFLALALTPRSWKEGGRRFVLANPVLLAGSLAFVHRGAGPFARWLAGLALTVWLAGLAMAWARRAGETSGRFRLLPEALLTIAVTGGAVLFGVFKYARPQPPVLDDPAFAVPQLLVPLGLSFVVCHAVSYVVDVHRGEAPAQDNPITAGSYLLFFSLLCAGPLARYRDIAGQLIERRATMAAFAYGVRRWLVGFWKVAFLASALAGPADAALHGAVVGLEHVGLGARLAGWPRALRHGYALLTVLCLWVVFRAETLPDAGVMFAAMFGLSAAAEAAPMALTRVEWAAFVIGGLSVVPLWSGFSRWLVTVDALTTSILFLASTSVLFVWRRLVNAVLFVAGRRRR